MQTKKLTPLKAIRAKCVDCCCGSMPEVAKCPSEETCSLWPYRFGKNPNIEKKVYTAEEKEAMRERVRKLNSTRRDAIAQS